MRDNDLSVESGDDDALDSYNQSDQDSDTDLFDAPSASTSARPSTGGKTLAAPAHHTHSRQSTMDYEDDEDEDDQGMIDDSKDDIGNKFDEDPLDDDEEDDDLLLSESESEPERPVDRRDTFHPAQSQSKAIKIKVKAAPVERAVPVRQYRKKMKVVPYDPVHIPVGDKVSGIDKLLSYRVNQDGSEELLVKYKSMSYYHAEWISRDQMELERGAKNRIRKFLDKPSWDHYSEDEPFNPSFLKIDRIIDVGEHNHTIMYLVKWVGLFYEQSTWETHDVVESIDPDKIAEYTDRSTLKPAKRLSYSLGGRRQPSGRWIKFDESPVYKNDNMLRTYQLEGLNWLMFCWYAQQNSILADEMGLGKTVQSTVFLNQLYHQENLKGPFLVVTPLSTIGNWEREIRGWTDMNVVVYHGSQPSRNLIVETEFYYRDENGAIIPDVLKVDVILTTYEMAMSGASQLRPIPWRAVVLDEAHRLKNRSSKVCEILKTYTMEHRVLLTGTPLQNSLDELWALLNFLEPAKFASEQDFKVNYGSLNTAADVERLQALLKPLMLRRLKEDVEKSIPVKEETIVEVELTTTQKKWYRSILEKNFSWLKQGTSKKSNVPNLINTMIELRKCCIHPWLLKGAEEQILEELHARTPEQQFQALIQSSGKMVLIDKLLKKLKQGGHKVLIFSQMTKCLDLIQDYLRLRGWLFERIDGGVRSDLRQASIDRFSAPGSDSFVFLLCTRAGGVGINLTAADTCIIFDSDWNPQNDLQAQSRCHRIGQKKTVQIYRLVTRNTYEREMFDRASLKLGLDRAVLQRMDAQSGGFSGLDMGSSKHTGLTAEEIEDLLKKGAYGAFMDDEASKQFCEEDIDQILERRTQVIRHNATEETGGDEKSSIFSKATFQAAGSAADVNVNDPDFWDKVAKQAEFTLVEEAPDDDYLIMDAPRSRRQVNRYGQKNEPELIQQQQEALEAIIPSSPSPPPAAAAPKPKDEIKLWSLTERTRLERILMQHGFNNWRKIRESFPRRSVFDLQACCRVLLKYCLEHSAGVDPDVIKEVKRALECFPHRTTPPPDEPTEEDVENRSFALSDMGEDLDPEDPPEVPEDELPYPGATERQKLEFLSFCSGDNRDFTEHIGRKSKNILIRVALLFNIRNKCDPKPDMFIPKFLGAPPAPWWGDLEDKHIMMGICKHGYQQKYNKIWDDPAFCFKERFRQAVLEGKAVVTAQAYNKGGSAQDAGDDDGDDAADVGAKADVDAEGDIEMQADAPAAAAAAAATGAASGVSTPVPPLGDDEAPVSASAPGDASAGATPAAGAAETFLIPSATDLGVRVRRIINAMSKHRQFLVRERMRKEAVNEKKRAVDEQKAEKLRLRDKDFSKKQRHDFQRILTSWGLPRQADNPTAIDWAVFKKHAELDKKSDEAMEFYYNKVMKLSREVIAINEASRKTVVPAVAPATDAPAAADSDIAMPAVDKTEQDDAKAETADAPESSAPVAIKAEAAKAEDEGETPAAPADVKTEKPAVAAPLASEADPIEPDQDADADADADQDGEGGDANEQAQKAGRIIVDTDGEVLTLEKAKKVVKRVELFEKLRSGILTDEQLEKKIQAVRRHGKASMPKWWEYTLDKWFLIALDRYGLLRTEELLQDTELPFYELHQEFLKSLEVRKEQNLRPDELVDSKFDDKFWPREAVVMRRFELLVNYAARPLAKKSAASSTKKPKMSAFTAAAYAAASAAAAKHARPDPIATPMDEDADSSVQSSVLQGTPSANSSKPLRLKLKLGSAATDENGADAAHAGGVSLSPTKAMAGALYGEPGSGQAGHAGQASGATPGGMDELLAGNGLDIPAKLAKPRGSRAGKSGGQGPAKTAKAISALSGSGAATGDTKRSLSDSNSSGGDTDDMLVAASKRVGASGSHHKKKKRRHTDFDPGEVLASLRYGAGSDEEGAEGAGTGSAPVKKHKRQRKEKKHRASHPGDAHSAAAAASASSYADADPLTAPHHAHHSEWTHPQEHHQHQHHQHHHHHQQQQHASSHHAHRDEHAASSHHTSHHYAQPHHSLSPQRHQPHALHEHHYHHTEPQHHQSHHHHHHHHQSHGHHHQSHSHHHMPHDPALPHQHPSHVHDPAAATAAAAIAPAAPVAAPLHHDYHLQQPGVPHYAMGHSPIHHTPAHAVYPPPQHAAGPMQPMQPMYEQQPPPAHYSQPVHGHYGAPPAAAMHPMETGSHGAVAPPDQHLHHQ